MKSCPKCAEKIQASAKKCKHCGSDVRNWFVRHKIITGFLILFIFGAFISAIDDGTGNSSSRPTTSSSTSPTVEEKIESIKVTARDLFAEYEANEIAADEKYKKKVLEVSGTIEDIGKDILDSMYVSLKTAAIFGSVQCMLEDSEQSKASTLQKGASIVVEGRNDGKLGNVILRDCVIR